MGQKLKLSLPPLLNFKENFQVLFLFLWLVEKKKSGFRAKTPQFRLSNALHLNSVNMRGVDRSANSSGSKK